MSEKAMWGAMRDGLKPSRWKYMRIEARMPMGVPDVSFVATRSRTGWMELKHSSKRAKRVQQLPHFTVPQRQFLNEWPHSFLMWRIGKDWLLFDQSFDLLGHVPFQTLTEIAKWHWVGTPNWELLASLLQIEVDISAISAEYQHG